MAWFHIYIEVLELSRSCKFGTYPSNFKYDIWVVSPECELYARFSEYDIFQFLVIVNMTYAISCQGDDYHY